MSYRNKMLNGSLIRKCNYNLNLYLKMQIFSKLNGRDTLMLINIIKQHTT